MSREDDVKRAREWLAAWMMDHEDPEGEQALADLIAAVRAETLEEAALVCEDTDVSSLDDAADRIRALKETL